MNTISANANEKDKVSEEEAAMKSLARVIDFSITLPTGSISEKTCAFKALLKIEIKRYHESNSEVTNILRKYGWTGCDFDADIAWDSTWSNSMLPNLMAELSSVYLRLLFRGRDTLNHPPPTFSVNNNNRVICFYSPIQ